MKKTTNKILSALIAASMILGMMTTATVASEPDNESGSATVQETVETSAEEQQEPAAEETPAAEQSEEKQEEAAVPTESTEAEEPEQTGQKEEQTVEEQTAEQPGQGQPAAEEQKEDAAEAVTEKTPEAAAVDMPAQTLTKSVKVTDSNNKKSTVTVTVTAPEGAFPKKSKIVLRAVGPNDQAGGSGQTVLEAIQDTTGREILNVVAAEIAFTDAKGNEIEPAVPVKVSVKNAKLDSAIAPADSFYLVRINGNGDADQMDQVNIDQPNLTASFACDESAVFAITQQAEAAAFVQQPENQKVFKNTEAAFKAEVNLPYDTYQWQYSKDGGNTWKNLSKTTYGSSDSLTFTAKASYDGYQYRCVVTLTDKRKITSDAAALTIDKPAITEQPADQTADTGDTVAFSVEAYGEMKACQWQYSKNAGETWKNLSVKTYGDTNVLSFTMKKSYDGYQYRCRITFTDGTKLTSDAAQLHWAAAVAMPAVKLTSDADGADIKITAPEGALPEGTSVTTEEVDPENAGDITDLVENGEILYAVNISFEDQNGDSVEPLKDVRVELNVDGASWDENCKLVHFREDGSKEIVENAVFKDGKITFSSDAFSVYAVVGDNAVEDDSRATLNFYGKNPTEPIATVYVKKSDTASELEYIIFDPGVGSIDNLESGEFFHGWNISPVNTTDGAEYTVNTPVKTIEDVREFFADDSLVIHEGDVYNIYAMIFRAYKIQYKDEDNATIHTAVKINKTGEPVDYTIDQTYTPKDANANFEGWNVTLGSENISNASAAAPYPYGTNMTISGDVTFTVNAPLGAWLSFLANGRGATYTPPQFIKSGETTVRPADPTRQGYEFVNWYETQYADNQEPTTSPYSFGSNITSRVTLYAKWRPVSTAKYTVIIWKQNVSGSGYDFAEAIELTGTVGTNVNTVQSQGTGDDRYARVNNVNKQYTGFHLKEFDQNVTIAAEGTTVVNVRYDRNQYTLTFQVGGGGYNPVAPDDNSGTQYGLINGRYVELYYNNGTWYSERRYSGLWPFGHYEYSNPYTGDRYRYSNYKTVKTITALYQQNISSNFPIHGTDGVNYNGTSWNPQDSDTFKLVLVLIDTMPAENITFRAAGATQYTQTMRYYVETLPGQTAEVTYGGKGFVKLTEQDAHYNFVTYDEDFIELSGYDRLGSDPAFYNRNGTMLALYYQTGTINFYYTRKLYSINYMDGAYKMGDGQPVEGAQDRGQLKHVDDIPYQADLTSYKEGGANSYEPSYAGYEFAGWYIDKSCTTAYEFDGASMPEGGITVYAKWIKKQYRVFLHPNVPTTEDIEWGQTDQKMSFRVNDGEKIGGGSVINGTRAGYELIGWYTNEACTSLYDFDSYELNDTLSFLQDYDQTQPTELDKWGNPTDSKNEDSEQGRFWINKKLELYAKWRAILVGAKGINIIYSANDTKNNIAGVNAPPDTFDYLDRAQAVAGAASTPTDNTMQFKHWVVQKWNEDTGEYEDTDVVVNPGESFEVLKSSAKVEVTEYNTDGTIKTATYTVQVRAEYGPKEIPTPTHLTWYDNFTENPVDNTNYFTDYDLQINEAVDIKAADTFNRPGYNFLGWARVNTTDDSGNPLAGYKLEPRNLTDSDLFLKYVEAEGETAAHFEAEIDGTWKPVTQVAADEVFPYHDLYAVWEEKEEFYVFHSSDCSVETYYVDDYKGGNFNIASKVKSGHLYAVYYHDYAGKGNYNNDGKATTSGMTIYSLANVSSITWSNPCTANGTAFTPVKDTTYYLKELPNAYLQTSQYEVVHNETKIVHHEYLVAGIDDNNYGQIGFTVRTVSSTNESSVIDYDHVPTYGRVEEKHYAESDGNGFNTELNTEYKTISDFYSALSAGSVAVQEIPVPKSGTKTLIEPYLVTPDGVKVTSAKIRRITISVTAVDGQISTDDMTVQNLGNRSKAVYVAMTDVSNAPAVYALAYTDAADAEKRKGKTEATERIHSDRHGIIEPIADIPVI